VKPGGSILLLAECSEGPGAPEFRRMLLEEPSDREFLKRIEGAPVTVDQWQLEKLALVTTSKQVLFYTPGLPEEYHGSLWGRAFESPETALKAFTAGLAPGSRVAVIPEGPYVLAKAGSAEREPVGV
jgi:lactate racemase